MLSCFKRIAMLALLACVFIPSTSTATDLLTILQFDDYERFELRDEVEVVVQVCNINVLTANSYVVNVKVKNFNTNQIIYNESVTGTNLAAFANTYVKLPNFSCPDTGEFDMIADVEFAEDINLNNNLDMVEIDVEIPQSTGLEFLAKLLGPSNEIKFDSTRGQIFGYSYPFGPLTSLHSYYDKSELDVTFNDYTYVGWVIPDSYTLGSESYVITQGYGETMWSIYPIRGYPMINNEPLIRYDMEDSLRIAGGYFDPWAFDSVSIFSEYTGMGDASAGAIVVGGKGFTKLQYDALGHNLRIVESELTTEYYGPRVAKENLVSILSPTMAQILAAIQVAKDKKYNNLYFYYGGMASATGLLLLDGVLPYKDLLTALDESDIEDIDVIVDAPYSGGIIGYANDGFKDQKLTISTSSHKDSAATISALGGTSAYWAGTYTLGFAKAYGDPAADGNKDGITTTVEAQLTLQGNSEDTLKKKVKFLGPQVFIVARPSQFEIDSPITLPNGDISITPRGSSIDQVVMELGLAMFLDGLPLAPADSAVVTEAVKRMWSIHMEGQTAATFDLQFTIRAILDSIYKTHPLAIPGLIRRDSAGEKWAPYYPAVYDEDRQWIRALGVNRFSDWAIAMVMPEEVKSVDVASMIDGLSTYPNPFSTIFTIRFEAQQSGNATIALYDATGRAVIEPFETTLGDGTQVLQLDGSMIPAGTYHLAVTNAAGSTRTLVVKQ